MAEVKHQVVTKDHRGNEVVLSKPVNESAMTPAERDEWHRKRHEHLLKQEGTP